MNAKQIYTQAYSDRRAVKSKYLGMGDFLVKYNVTPKHAKVSQKAVDSFVNRNRTQNISLQMRTRRVEKLRKQLTS